MAAVVGVGWLEPLEERAGRSADGPAGTPSPAPSTAALSTGAGTALGSPAVSAVDAHRRAHPVGRSVAAPQRQGASARRGGHLPSAVQRGGARSTGADIGPCSSPNEAWRVLPIHAEAARPIDEVCLAG